MSENDPLSPRRRSIRPCIGQRRAKSTARRGVGGADAGSSHERDPEHPICRARTPPGGRQRIDSTSAAQVVRQTDGGVVRSAAGRAELAGGNVIVLGIVLLVVGYFLAIPILWTLGIILVVIGVILVLLGTAGHAIGGRRHYY
ncbi:MAG: DUF6131 family protein [Pseudonocardiaceae bacterium]